MDKEHLNHFPFSAVLNADEVKKAIKCMLVSPGIRTVLIQGISGSAKTTIVRSISGISEKKVINLPLNATEGQIIGSLDIEGTMTSGERRILPGMIKRAENNILYGDDANLMDRSILSGILKAALGDEVVAEREGLSWSYRSEFKFIATMNILEDPMDPHLLDMFDLCVNIGNTNNEKERYEILRRKTEYDAGREAFRSKYGEEDAAVSEEIRNASGRIDYVSISDDLLKVIAELCTKVGAEGHRGDIAMTNAAVALAALDKRDDVTLDDIKEAAKMCLGHRMTEIPEEPNEKRSSESGPEPPDLSSPEMTSSDDGKSGNENENDGDQGMGGDDSETVFSVGNTFSVIDFTELKRIRDINARSYGKHGKTKSTTSKGRYVRSRASSDYTDIAIDASMRAAAPYQKFRKKDGLALSLETSDLRQKVRERKSGATVMFLVDASGSMGARKRMVSVKGAVFSLLKESYKNRDKVGLTAFRRDHAEVLLPFTKSVDFAYRKLKDMPTGGTTPLAAALLKVYMELKKETRMRPNERYYVVLTTDGRANVAMSGGDAFKDALSAARHIGNENIASWIVVDTGTGYPHTDNALNICRELNGTYLKLEDLNSDGLAHRIRTIVGGRGYA
ncbi:MAG: VWA domain-containing protein [Methanomassiliicoccaceae archaeon]|nr:VWA domain-containing protein [Methanomassiliicoccaceae archaeon]